MVLVPLVSPQVLLEAPVQQFEIKILLVAARPNAALGRRFQFQQSGLECSPNHQRELPVMLVALWKRVPRQRMGPRQLWVPPSRFQ